MKLYADAFKLYVTSLAACHYVLPAVLVDYKQTLLLYSQQQLDATYVARNGNHLTEF